MDLELITPPAIEPVSLDEAKLHCRVDGNDEDTLIAGLIVQAREWAERFTRRALITQTWRGWLCEFPYLPVRLGESGWWYPIKIPKGPVTSIESIAYTDRDGNDQVLDASAYKLHAKSVNRFPLVSTAYGTTWPTARAEANSVRIQFTAGHGSTDINVPQSIREAIKFHIAWHYDNRQMSTFGAIPEGAFSQVERALQLKLADWRIFEFG